MRDESNQGRGLHKLLVAVGLLLVSTRAWAPAPVYFDLGGLILLVVGLFSLAVMGVGWSIGRGKGAAWSICLLLAGFVAFALWAAWSEHERKSEHAAWTDFAYGACHTRELLKLPVRSTSFQRIVLVLPHADNPLPGREDLYFQGGHPAPGVEMAADFPSTRQEGTGYVRISGTVEPVPGAEGEKLWGFDVVVEDHTGAVIAKLRDYYLGHWCSGSTPSDRIERFLRGAIGRTAGLSLKWNTAESLRLTPRALLAASTSPGGKEKVQRSSANDANSKPNEKILMHTLGFPTSAQCRQPHEGLWVCLEGTPDANELRPGQSAVHAGRWLAFNCDTSHCGTSPYRIDERDLEGRLLAIWHVRMPAEFQGSEGSRVLLDMELAGNTLKMKLGRSNGSTWDGKRTTWTYGDIVLAHVELDRRLLLPAIPLVDSQEGLGAAR